MVFNGWEIDQPFELTDIYHIGEGPVHMPPNMDVFNFVARRCENIIENDLTLDQSGELWIGRDANLGIVPTPGNPINEASVMKVLVTQNQCDQSSTKVIVKPESAIRIGDANASGELFFSENTELRVKENASVEVKNSSKLTIGSGAIANLEPMSTLTLGESSELVIESGGVLEVAESAEVTASHFSKITIENGGVLKVSESAKLLASYLSNIIIEGGGILEVEPTALVKIDRFSKLFVKPEGELIIPALAELKTIRDSGVEIQENSSLRIQTDAILNVDKRSEVSILEGATLYIEELPSVTIDGGSKIDIKGGYVFEGELIIEAPNGYIDIHRSTYDPQSIQGSVTILGSNKSRRILKLRKHVRFLMNTYDLTLENGTVEIGSEFSSIRSSTINANSIFSLKNVVVRGVKPLLLTTDPQVLYWYGTAYGLELGGVSVLDVENCRFENLTKGIILRSGVPGSTLFNGSYNIRNSIFNDVFIGIETDHVERININACEFENYGVPENYSTIGVFLHQTNDIELKDSRISNFKYGIRTKSPIGNHWTNIDMKECAEIIDCGVGIYGYNVNFKMRNSSFFFNDFCVAGFDVLLDIPSDDLSMNQFVHCVDDDGNSGYSGPRVTDPSDPNEFDQNFIIKYSSENSELWGGHGSSGRINESGEGGTENREIEGETSGSGGTGNGAGNEGGDGDPETSRSPTPPNYGPEIVLPPYIDPQEECGFIFSIKNEDPLNVDFIPAENNYWVDYELISGLHYAITYFGQPEELDYEPLVLLPDLPIPGNCPVPRSGVNGRFSDGVVKAKVFPNPAADQITIQLPYESKIRVMNLTGQVLFQSKGQSANHNILCASWSPGLYFLRLENGETFRIVKI